MAAVTNAWRSLANQGVLTAGAHVRVRKVKGRFPGARSAAAKK
jgi:hypothetical protein